GGQSSQRQPRAPACRLRLAGAGALQHRRGVLHALGAAGGCRSAHRGAGPRPRARGRRADVRRAAGAGRSPQRPAGLAGRGARGPRGDRDAATLRDRGGLHGGVPARRRGHAAVDAVRTRGAGLPAAGQRSRGGDLRREFRGQPGVGAHRVPRAAHAGGRGRGGLAGRPGLRRRGGAPGGGLHGRAHQGRRRRRADLHQRHHRPAQRCADPAPRADRQPAGLRVQPELVRLRWPWQRIKRGRVLVARRLGLDRRADGRPAAHAVLRPPHRRLQRPLQPGAGVHADAAARRDPHLPLSHRAQGHDEGLPRAEAPVPPEAAGHDERRGGGGRCGVRLLPRPARRGGQRDVRPDRDELRGGQLLHERRHRRRPRLAGAR
ncbi:MAG: Acetyl-CoA synthetase, partial [uncultured Ramlibacter sp.]